LVNFSIILLCLVAVLPSKLLKTYHSIYHALQGSEPDVGSAITVACDFDGMTDECVQLQQPAS